MPRRLGGAVEHRILIAEPTLHRDDTAGVHIHRHEAALNFRHLPQRPADERPVFIIGDSAHQHHIANRNQIARNLGLFGQSTISQKLAGPGHIIGRDEMAVFIIGDAFDSDPCRCVPHLQHHRRIPACNIARHFHRCQCRTPQRLIAQNIARQGQACAAPDAQTPVKLFQPPAQCRCGFDLHGGVDGGADRQATAKELVFAKAARQLPPDLIGEIVARRQGFAERRIIAVLHRQQRLGGLCRHRRLVDIAVLHHFAQHIVAPLCHPFLGAHRMIFAGGLRHCRQNRRFARCQIRQGFVEIGLCRSGNAVGVLTQKNLVEVKFQDLVFGQSPFNPRRQNQFLDLALAGAVARQQKVLHHLLGDGGCAAQIVATRFNRRQRRSRHATGVKAVVSVEILVFGRDEGLFDDVGNFLDRGKDPAFLGKLVDDAPFAGIDAADGRRSILRQLVIAGQIAAIHPENGTHHQRCEKRTQGQGAEQGPEKRYDESDQPTAPVPSVAPV